MAATATVVAQLNSSSGGAQTGVTASFTPTANTKLVVIATCLNNNHTTAKSWAVSGGSLSWTIEHFSGSFEITEVGANFDAEMIIAWAAVGSSPSSMTVTVDAYSGTDTGWYGLSVWEVAGSDPSALGEIQVPDFHDAGAASPTLALGSAKTANSVLLGVVHSISDGAAPAWAADPSGWTVATKPTGTDAVNVSSFSSTTDADAALSGYGTTTNTAAMLGALIEIGEYDGLVEQAGFRWGTDDASESAHGWEAAQDVDLTAPVTDPKLLRFLLQATDDPISTAFTLQHQVNGTGGYVTTPVGSTITPTVDYGAVGTEADSAGDPSPSYPAGGSALSEYILVTASKPSTANGGTLADPSGWTRRGENSGATDGDTGGYGSGLAADTGNMNLYLLTKDSVDGTEPGTALGAVNHSGQNNATATLVRLDKSEAGSVSWAAATGKDTSAGNVSVTTGTIDLAPGDVLVWAMAIPTDVTTPAQFSAHAISATGITFDTVSEVQEGDATSGNDQGSFIARTKVLTGSGTVACTITATAGGTTTNVRGPLVLLRARPEAAYDNPVYLVPSSNITDGEATTQRLTGASGSFTAGVRHDVQNPADPVNIGADGNTELEFSIALQDLVDDDYVEFRLDPVDTLTEVPRWTVGSGSPTGTGSAVYGGTVAATGTPTRLGTGTLAYGGSLAATGQAGEQGTAAGSYGGSVTATGTAVKLGTGTAAYGGETVAATGYPVEVGTSALAYGGSVAGTGLVTRYGSSTLAYGGSVAGTGEAAEHGSSTLAYGGSVAGTGQAQRLGTGALAYGGSVAATGFPVEAGSGTLPYGGTVAGSGLVTRLGTGSVGYGGSVTGTGQTPGGPTLGTAAMPYGGSVAGSGQVTRFGSVAVGYGGSVAATGQTQRLGTGSLGYGGGVTGSGTPAEQGTGAGSYGGSVAGSGQVQRLGTAALVYGGTVTGTGTTPTNAVTGTGTLPYGGSVSGSGQAQRRGTVVVGYGGTVAGSGRPRRLGSSTLAYGSTVAATGSTVRFGTVVLAYGGSVHGAGFDPTAPRAPLPPQGRRLRLASQAGGLTIRGRGVWTVSGVRGLGRRR